MMQDLPLTGVRILERATVVAAPTVARIMADYGRLSTRPAGTIGQDTDAVLRDLDYCAEEITTLHEKKSVK